MADPPPTPTLTTCPQCGASYPREQTHSCPQQQRPELVPTLAPQEGAALEMQAGTPTPPARPGARAAASAAKAPEFDDLIGAVINDRYEIEKRLSKGGMGVVYQARHRALDTPVAIKVLLRPRNEEDQARFLLEAKIASRVRHANTVYISDFGQLPDGRNYLAMELLKGRPLSDEVGRGPMPVIRALGIAVQIARGLKAVHDLGIIHRDIKPANVFLVEQDGNPDFVKIVDFGIAKVLVSGERPLSPLAAAQSADRATAATEGKGGLPDITQPGTVMGTPAYMSPEQTRGEPIDATTDQYAFGCMLYQLLTGRVPFIGRNMMDVMLQHSDPLNLPTPMRQQVPGLAVSDPLDQAVMRMLAKLPGQRYPSMGEVEKVLAEELDLLLLARGDKRLLTAAHVEALEQKARAGTPAIAVGRLRVPVWLLGSLVVALLCSVGAAAYYRWVVAPRAAHPRLRPGELWQLRERALVTLRGELAQALPDRRAAALLALGESRDPALGRDIEPLLKDADPDVQAQAAKALALLGDPGALPALRAAQAQPLRPEVKVEVAAALRQLREPSGQLDLLAALESSDAEIQFTAAMLLCDDPSAARAQDLLRTYAQRPQTPKEIRQSILGCQAQGGSSEARAALADLARTRGPEQVAAAGLLWQLGDEGSHELLRRAVRQGGVDGLRAARILAGADEPESLQALAAVLKNPDVNLAARQLAADGLGDGGNPFYARLLGTYLSSTPPTEPPLRITAAGAIVRLSAQGPSSLSASSLRWAQGALTDHSWLVRQAALEVIAAAPTPEVMPLLAGLLHDADPRLRRSALRALGRRPAPAALQALHDGLVDSEASVRLEAIRGLGRLLITQKAAATPAPPEPAQWLRAHYDRATPAEQVVLSGVLEQLGDSSHRAQMLALLGSADAALRRLVVRSGAAGAEAAVRALDDADPAVRLAAATQLAERGDKRAVAVLREAVQRGGVAGIAAYGLLARLGEVSVPPVDLEATLNARAVATRLAAVAALRSLPPALALPLLTRVAHDPDPQVRRRAAAIAAALDGGAGTAVVARLLSDRDPAVRARAQSLLSQPAATRPSPDVPDEDEEEGAGAAPERRGESPPASTPTSEPPATETEAAEAETPGDKGLLILETEPGVLYQLDHRPFQSYTGQPIPVAPGPHHLAALSGQQDFTAVAGQRTNVKLPASRIEQLAQAGRQSLQRGDYRKAQRQLDQAVSLCGQGRMNATACAILTFDLSYTLGQIREKQLEWPEAMTEYQRTMAMAQKVRGGAEIKARAQEAIARLRPRVCKVVIKQQVGHRCVEETVWVGPGARLIKVGGKLQQIDARVDQDQQVGACK